jgi:Mrp family chromosome partitioning ATPase
MKQRYAKGEAMHTAAEHGRTGAPAGSNDTDRDFDQLRDRLLAPADALPIRGRLVTLFSLQQGEGVTAVTVGLARSASRLGGMRTLIIEHGQETEGAVERLRRTGISLLPPAPSDARADAALSPASHIHSTNGRGIDLLRLDPTTASLVSPENWDRMLDALRSRYGLILVDAGSRRNPGAAIWQQRADQALLVIDASRTTAEQVEGLRQTLSPAGGAPIGIVLNKRRYHIPDAVYRLLH